MIRINTNTVLHHALLSVAVMLASCVNTLEVATPRGGERVVSHEGAVADAKAYFDSHFGQNTRSNNQTPSHEAPYVVGNLIPDWESGVTVADNAKSYTDFAIQKEYRFFLALEDEEQRICGLELYSRLASVVDFGLEDMNQYVATYIPDISFLSCYDYFIEEGLLTCEHADWFTGVVLYTDLYGYHIAAYKYYDGVVVDSSFLYDTQKTTEENIADFMRVMSGISLFVAPTAEQTRAIVTQDISGGQIIYYYDESGKLRWSFCQIDGIVATRPTPKPITLIGDDFVDVTTTLNDTRTIAPIIPLGGGGGGSSNKEEKLDSKKFTDKILKNTLSPSDSIQLHTMLTEILNDCMGQTMLQEIYDKGVQINIKFNRNSNNSQYQFSRDIHSSTVVMCNDHSEGLVHELFHFVQHYTLGYDTYQSAYVNFEVEAHIASLMYMSHTTNSSAHSRYDEYCSTTWGGYQEDCAVYLNTDGSIPQGQFWEEMFKSLYDDAAWYYKRTHQNRNYDTNRNSEDNISNLRKLFENCD